MDEEEELEENEDAEEEELNIESDHAEHAINPWDMYVDNDADGDMDDTTEDTALLRTQAARTEIIVTPISPVREEEADVTGSLSIYFYISLQVNSSHSLTRMGSSEDHNNQSLLTGQESRSERRTRAMDLLTPDMAEDQ